MWNTEAKLLQPKYRPIFSPRTSYVQLKASDEDLLADMTLNFDKFTINLLKKEFEARQGQITLIQFISIVNQHLKSWQSQLPNREVRLVRCLTILFKEIDINGNGLLDWEQFTNYIIEKATVLKNLKTKSDEVKKYTRSNIKCKEKVESVISKCIFIEDINRVAVFQEGTNAIKFMNPDTGQFSGKNLLVNMKQLVVNISSVKKEKDGRLKIKKKDLVIATQIRVLDIIYISDEKYKILVVATSDGMVKGWKYNGGSWIIANQLDNQQELIEHHFNQEIYSLAWDSINQILYCGQNCGRIYMWNLKTDTERLLQSVGQQHHSMIITQIIPMPKLQFVASASLDTKIILWNTINYKIKSVYKQHTRGVLTMAFNQSLILLFSAGFDHQICIWNPYISTLIHKMSTHNSPILCMKITENNNQLISIDNEGIVKITDTRRFNNISSFSVVPHDESLKFVPSSLCVIKKPLKMVIVGNGVNMFEYDKLYNPNTADDNYSLCCKFIDQSLMFLTPAGNKVKVWNSLNGDINKIFLEICPTDISSFCLDHLQKRMIIGTYRGDSNIYNVINGAKLKQLPKHNSEVTHILTYKIGQMELFFTAGIDGLIYIYKEMEDFYEIPRTINIKNMVISKMVYCPKTSLLIVGTNSGWIGFYDRETAKLVGNYNDEEQITGLQLTEFQLLVTNARGKITFVNLPPSTQRYQQGFSFRHHQHDPLNLNKLTKTSQIAMSAFSQQDNLLYVVDQKSYITAYQLNLDEQLMKINSKNTKIQTEQLDKAVSVLWMTKAHSQVMKSIQFVQSQKLLLTTAFDKKVNIFCSKTGVFIDSLQQNYEKFQPNPVAYQRISNGEIVSASMEPLFKRRPSIRTSTRYRISLAEPDPFYEYESIKSLIQNPRSNPEWKLFIHAHKHYLKQKSQFEAIISEVKQASGVDAVHLNPSKANIFEQSSLTRRKQELDRMITQRKYTLKMLSQGVTSRGTLMKESVIRQQEERICLHDRLKIKLNKQQTKIFNMFKKQPTKKTVLSKMTERQNQLKLVDKLSRSKNNYTIREDSIFKSEEQKNAARRLNLALGNISNCVASASRTEKSFFSSKNKRLPHIL